MPSHILDHRILGESLQAVEIGLDPGETVIAEAGGRPGHIFNLGHGIVPEIPVENVKAMIDLIHSIPLQQAGA